MFLLTDVSASHFDEKPNHQASPNLLDTKLNLIYTV